MGAKSKRIRKPRPLIVSGGKVARKARCAAAGEDRRRDEVRCPPGRVIVTPTPGALPYPMRREAATSGDRDGSGPRDLNWLLPVLIAVTFPPPHRKMSQINEN